MFDTFTDLRPEEADGSRRSLGTSLSFCLCGWHFPYAWKFQSVLTYQKKHDPEDEPVVTPLSPSYFEFDRETLSFSTFFDVQIHPLLIVHKDDLSKDQLKGAIDIHSLCTQLTYFPVFRTSLRGSPVIRTVNLELTYSWQHGIWNV